MLLETLRARDPVELAEGLRRWEVRFRQLAGGPFRGELKFLQLGGAQIIHASGNRRLQHQGSLPPGSFGFAPVLPRNAGALWRGATRSGYFACNAFQPSTKTALETGT
jgi:hypothetical protein